jgi:major membrane immunogen (membrane-anchored lipoprotein)
MLKVFTAIMVAVLMMAALLGCGKSEPAGAPGEPEYADVITEGILQAFNTGDYAAYSEHFDEAMKKAMPEAVFEDTRAQIQAGFGDYVSKEFSSTELNVQGIYTAVIYKAEFSKKSGVQVKVVFLETDDAVFVSGLWFQ